MTNDITEDHISEILGRHRSGSDIDEVCSCGQWKPTESWQRHVAVELIRQLRDDGYIVRKSRPFETLFDKS